MTEQDYRRYEKTADLYEDYDGAPRHTTESEFAEAQKSIKTTLENQNHQNQNVQNHYHQYRKQYHHNQDNNNYNNNNYHTEPGVFSDGKDSACSKNTNDFCSAEDLEAIREAYEDNIGTMTGIVARIIENALVHGLTVDEVLMAIDETGLAPRASAYYFKAIIENWCAHGVTVSKAQHYISANKAVKWWKT